MSILQVTPENMRRYHQLSRDNKLWDILEFSSTKLSKWVLVGILFFFVADGGWLVSVIIALYVVFKLIDEIKANTYLKVLEVIRNEYSDPNEVMRVVDAIINEKDYEGKYDAFIHWEEKNNAKKGK